ncbi:MAG: hypothetical protein IPK04_16600 [Bdellovibrionales bacterium]|nr:hypothetical protein [Bdellovibrionales bacterium]
MANGSNGYLVKHNRCEEIFPFEKKFTVPIFSFGTDQSRTTHFDLKKLVIQTGKFIVCGIPLALRLQSFIFMATSADSFLYKAAGLILASLIGGGLFALASRGLRLEEYDLTVGRLLKRVGSKLTRL